MHPAASRLWPVEPKSTAITLTNNKQRQFTREQAEFAPTKRLGILRSQPMVPAGDNFLVISAKRKRPKSSGFLAHPAF